MASLNTEISWCDKTWNFIRGCRVVSTECENCYAQGIAYRFSGEGLAYGGLAKMVNGKPRWTGKLTVVEKDLELPLKWHKPERVFVNSMSDLFYDEVPFDIVDKAFAVMHQCPHLTFQILTKRPERMLEYFKSRYVQIAGLFTIYNYGLVDWPLPNVWLGVSVGNQEATKRISPLLQIPAAVRFLSCEPLIGPVSLDNYQLRGLQWVIVGGESGRGARPMHPDWARTLRDQCQSAGVAYHFKQWGAWVAKALHPDYPPQSDFGTLTRSGDWFPTATTWNGRQGEPGDDYEYTMRNVGKKAAGRLLDGREWNEFPKVVANEQVPA
jgi:protein gp37